MASQSNGLRPTFHRSDFSRSRILFDDIRPTALPCRSSRNVRLATKARCFGNLQESFQLRNQGSRVFPDPLNNLIQLVNQFWSLFNQFWPRLMITLSMNCPQVHERWGAEICPRSRPQQGGHSPEGAAETTTTPNQKGGKNTRNHHPEPATRSTDETTLQAAEPPKARMKPPHPR